MTELIVALDEPSAARIGTLVTALGDGVSWYKVGYEAFYSLGSPLVEDLHARGKRIFLDLKLHDVPNTVAAGLRALAPLRPDFVTVHAGGGRAMLEAAARARDALHASGSPTKLLAVTVLTSLDESALRVIGVDRSPHQVVSTLAALAAECGVDGIVCAVDEVPIVRSRVGAALLTVCPGIRPAGDGNDDQKRTATPAAAALAGADYAVVGRPIVKAADPAAAAAAIAAELHGAGAFDPSAGR